MPVVGLKLYKYTQYRKAKEKDMEKKKKSRLTFQPEKLRVPSLFFAKPK